MSSPAFLAPLALSTSLSTLPQPSAALSHRPSFSIPPPAHRPRASLAVTRLRSEAALSLSLSSLSSSATPRVAVVGFVAPACRACKYSSRAYERLAAGTVGGDFFSVDVSELEGACKDMGVEAVPSWKVFVGDVGDVWEIEEIVGPRSVGKLEEFVRDVVEGGFDRAEWEVEED